jgi:hypothetical protein
MTDFNLVVKVKREGGKGWHWIDRAKYEADPSAYVLVDETGKPVEQPKRDPLDHDNDGNKGGTKAEPKNPELAALRKQYKEKFGKGTSPKWDADTIRAKLAAE